MRRVALPLFVALCAGPLNAGGAEVPLTEASFVLTDGWVELVLERDGKPLSGARVTVLTGATVWATGETGPTGRGTFPRPDGRTDCQVVLELESGPSAPVPLTFPDDGTVTPPRAKVQVAAECCRPVRRPLASPPPVPPRLSWDQRLALAGTAAIAGTAVAVVLWLRLSGTGRHQHGTKP